MHDHMHRCMSYDESRSQMMKAGKRCRFDEEEVEGEGGGWDGRGFVRRGWLLTPFIGGSFSWGPRDKAKLLEVDDLLMILRTASLP